MIFLRNSLKIAIGKLVDRVSNPMYRFIIGYEFKYKLQYIPNQPTNIRIKTKSLRTVSQTNHKCLQKSITNQNLTTP